MKIITYLGFTVLSVFIQFCVMDFIQEKIVGQDTNITSQRESYNDLLKNISNKPHALYYKSDVGSSLNNRSPSNKVYNNSSKSEIPPRTTDTTIFDVLYDENSTETEDTTSTESYSTTTEFDNVTEISFFEIKNKSTIPKIKPKTSFKEQCDCNLLYKVCDINCCCDEDCSEIEYEVFQCDKFKTLLQNELNSDGCESHLFNDKIYGSTLLENLFCVVKTNLPNKRNIKMYNEALIGQYYKWHTSDEKQTSYKFKRTIYKLGDPVWLLRNGTIYYLDFPAPSINNYCTDRVPISFLKNAKIKCNVKLNDLEMYNILKRSEEALIISSTNNTLNSSVLNCSNLHCINWTILACEHGACFNYNKSINEASCTDTICTNIALKIDYEFYYYDLKIVNATIKLHIKKISSTMPFMLQEINVNFYMANRSINNVVEFSGNPGYLAGLPVITSYAKRNYTENFFNNTSARNHFLLPESKDGLCVISNISTNIVKFGQNKRTKCRNVFPLQNFPSDKSNVCKNINDDIIELLRLKSAIMISPFGNPYDITDDNWIDLKMDVNALEPTDGQFNENSLKFHCFNIINRVSITFMFANIDVKTHIGQNKILSAKCDITTTNLSFNSDDISTVITIDIVFIDLSKPSRTEYAGGPHLNIHLPKDFFFPFPSNDSYYALNSFILTTICCVILLIANKITLE